MDQPSAPAVVEQTSPLPFAATLTRLEEAIARAGLTIFARVDHAANADAAGLAMPPATLLIYGNATGGTPVMQAYPLAALDLPLRVLVREAADGRAAIAFHPVADMLRPAGVAPEMAARLRPAQSILVAALTG